MVAPYVGAWIETGWDNLRWSIVESHPTWVRGLKHIVVHSHFNLFSVAPYVGAWIETDVSLLQRCLTLVAPYVGAWIET